MSEAGVQRREHGPRLDVDDDDEPGHSGEREATDPRSADAFTRDDLEPVDVSEQSAPAATLAAPDKARLGALVSDNFDFIWRSLRRLGVPVAEVDDCAQQVFWVAPRKLAVIALGSERAFLFSAALRVASDARRSRGRRREVLEDDAIQPTDPGPRPDEVAD